MIHWLHIFHDKASLSNMKEELYIVVMESLENITGINYGSYYVDIKTEQLRASLLALNR